MNRVAIHIITVIYELKYIIEQIIDGVIKENDVSNVSQ